MPRTEQTDREAGPLVSAALRSGTAVSLTVRSSSMLPVLRPGSIVKVQPVGPQPLQCGDVVLFERDGELVLHRLIRTLPDTGTGAQCITRGDRAYGCDPVMPPGAIHGVVQGGTPLQALDYSNPLHLLRMSLPSLQRLPVLLPADPPDATAALRARTEGLAGLLSRTLAPTIASRQPGLREAYVEAASRATLLLNALDQAICALAPIPVLPLKGAALCTQYYTSPAFRPYGDLDLLVRPGDADAAMTILLSLGYEHTVGQLPTGTPDPTRLLPSVLLEQHDTGVHLHLHWHPINKTTRFPGGTGLSDELWRVAVPGPGGAFRIPHELQLALLCAHAFGHSYDRLILVRDLWEVLEVAGRDFDWTRFCTVVEAADLVLPVRYSLCVAARLLPELAIPDRVLHRLRRTDEGRLGRLFMSISTSPYRYPEAWKIIMFRNAPGIPGKLRYLKDVLFSGGNSRKSGSLEVRGAWRRALSGGQRGLRHAVRLLMCIIRSRQYHGGSKW